MIGFRAEQLVFVDEAIFNETTGWRQYGYSPVGQAVEYFDDRTRTKSWSICPAYTTDGYLNCTGIKLGYYNGDEFFDWFIARLLPTAKANGKTVIIMDNVGIHQAERLREACEAFGCELHYLPPYSPDFNPIEMTFSVLKAWVRRHYHESWPRFSGSFDDWLRRAIVESQCDRFPREHFKRCGTGYIFEADLIAFEQQLAAGDYVVDFR
jgi:transposase